MARILAAMSGGVDSSVATALLVEAGHEVVGATLRTFCYSGTSSHARSCCGLEGVQDARSVARALDIPHSVFDVEEEFTRDVIQDFVLEYSRGRTPNPCVRCNSFTKFGDLLTRAREMGAQGIATGHYVRVEGRDHGIPLLLRGKDRAKDQAYFLWGLPRESLPFLHFPLGGFTKEEVRAMARKRGLVTADKPESQEICFVPTGDYRDLLRNRLDPVHPAFQSGDVVAISGEKVGDHQGYAEFTVGQRKGLPGGFPEAMFVVAIRPETREVVIGTREDLWDSTVVLHELNWLDTPPRSGDQVEVQLRHRGRTTEARVDRVNPASVALTLLENQFAITPGQSGVLYSGDRVLGGGRIAAPASSGGPWESDPVST